MPVAHRTLNGILKGDDTALDAPESLTDMLRCNNCPTESKALLKTPHGWVCPSCFKLIYVPSQTAAHIQSELKYNSIDSYEVDAYMLSKVN